jgi:hypothetical protein
MHSKKYLSFSPLIKSFTSLIKKIPDKRKKGSVSYSIHNTVMSAFACMYMQSPSLLRFQERLKKRSNRNNLETLFAVKDTPKEYALRNTLTSISPDYLKPIFKTYLGRLQRNNYLKQYQFINGKYLVSMDGTDYFSSKKISCSKCLQQPHKDGSITYSHKVVQPVIVKPGRKQVFPLMPEEITNSDGYKKQDCEINAAKRLIPAIRKEHPKLSIIYLADSIYATAPFIQDLLDNEDDYIFRAKPGDHKTLYKNMDAVVFQKHEEVDCKGRRFVYKWTTDVKLNNSSDIKVNVMQLFIVKTKKDGTQESTRTGVWITNLDVYAGNIDWLVKGARSRWKIENECFNTLKNHGYCMEHNYGHDDENLSMNFYLLILLSFFIHQILEFTDKLHKKARCLCGPLYEFWEVARSVFRHFIVLSWEELLQRMIAYEEDTWERDKDPPALRA